MKVRKGFVSNSSSTSFAFITKGNTLEDVYEAMRNYREYFHLWGAWQTEENEECADHIAFMTVKSAIIKMNPNPYRM